MNKFSKGLLSIVLAMCLSTSPMTAFADSSFDFIWLKVKDQNDTCLIDEIYGRDYLMGQHQSISLSSLANGNYFVEIFTAPERYTTYYSKIYGKALALNIIEQKIAFQMPLVYTSNVYKNGKYSTETGLDGYKYFDPTIAVFAQDHMLIGGWMTTNCITMQMTKVIC